MNKCSYEAPALANNILPLSFTWWLNTYASMTRGGYGSLEVEGSLAGWHSPSAEDP